MRRRLRLVALGLALGAVVSSTGSAQADDSHHGADSGGIDAPERVGLLLADHGEPPEYNAWTYESFREFFQHLIDMGLIPTWLTALETGTIVYDADCPACDEPSDSPRLIDAWLRPHEGPALFVPASDSLPAHYVLPGGPGFREPDIFEHVGLSAWHEWQLMGGRSPNHDEKLPRKQVVIDRLQAVYGERLAVRVGYMIDPRFGGGRSGIREALDALVNRERVDSLVVVYHGVGFSDIMQTHHLRHTVHEHLDSLGADIPVRFAEPPGTSEHYVRAAVEKVLSELERIPPDAAVAVHLSGHGLATAMCGEYDCGADAYHRSSADLYARVRPALEAAIDRPGRTEIFHVYGDGGDGDDDPGDEVDSPTEALDERAAAGFTHVIDVPYEFDANSRDTLIVLRHGYRREPPDWNHAWESRFTYEGIDVTIANVDGGDAHKIEALYDVTVDALDGLIEPGAGTASADHDAHPNGGTRESHPSHTVDAAAVGAPRSEDEHVGTAHATTDDDHTPATPHDDASAAAHTSDDHHAAAPASSHDHDSGTGTAGGMLLAIAGGAAIVGALAARGRPLTGRVLLGGLGVQLDGLALDVLIHADAGEPVHLLENGGHWLALGGLAATIAAAVVLLRRGVDQAPT